MNFRLSILVGIILLTACSPATFLKKEIQAAETQFNDHTGFMLYDPVTRKTLFEYNAKKYFTPASNTKIFTLYGSLQLIGDSIPGLRYTERGDSLIFWGTGDPSFLYDQTYNHGRVLDFLRRAPGKLFFSSANFHTDPFGPGWAWDDYLYYYSPERSSFPVYGNLIRMTQNQSGNVITIPGSFQPFLQQGDSVKGQTTFVREVSGNRVMMHAGNPASFPVGVPFHVSPELTAQLLSDTLARKVQWIKAPLPRDAKTLFSVPADSLYKTMMQESDNFIAEQLLLVCAGLSTDTLDTEVAIRTTQQKFLFDMPDLPKWVDGSGLSRYNLFTPRTIVRLWEKIYLKVPRERLFPLLATGSQSGTLKNWYKADQPYIYGKTGSLSNNHTLSGFLVTRKQKVLIFSFMNSNFVAPSSEIRKMMQGVLERVRDSY